jgi:hypothetical protein
VKNICNKRKKEGRALETQEKKRKEDEQKALQSTMSKRRLKANRNSRLQMAGLVCASLALSAKTARHMASSLERVFSEKV